MSKSKVRKKNGKKVKYTPPVQGISKTKMKKIQEYFKLQKEMQESQNADQLPSPPEEISLAEIVEENSDSESGPTGS